MGQREEAACWGLSRTGEGLGSVSVTAHASAGAAAWGGLCGTPWVRCSSVTPQPCSQHRELGVVV